MRAIATLTLVFGAIALLAPPVVAGGAKIYDVDRVTSPGGEMSAKLLLTNDSAKRAKFKVIAQVKGDQLLSKGPAAKAKGKKQKISIKLEAGESFQLDLGVGVPEKADGPVVLECKVKWKHGGETFEEGGYAYRDGAEGEDGEGDDGEGDEERPGGDRPDGKVVELEGTLYLESRDTYEAKGERGLDPTLWMPYLLTLVTEDGAEWMLFGPEADVLARLMKAEGIEKTTAWVAGVPMDVLPALEKIPDWAPAYGARAKTRTLWLLEWKARGIEDPRPKIVPHRYVLGGPLSKIDTARELVIRSESEWERLLEAAGIRLPDDWPPVYGDDPLLARGDRPEVPEIRAPWDVNFDKETVVAVFAGARRTTGYEVAILDVVVKEEALVVRYAVMEPQKWQVVVEVPTEPFAIVAIPVTDRRIAFVEVEAPDPSDEPVFGDR